MSDRVYVSPLGFARLRADLERAERAHRDACAESARACELSGDGWHDNPYFNQMQQQEAALAREVLRIRKLVDAAVLVPRPREGADTVEVGMRVRVAVVDVRADRESEHTWEIAGLGETDKASGRIAYDAPLASAILGHGVGDVLGVEVGGRQLEIEVLELLGASP